MQFTELKCPRVCIENPIGVMSSLYCKPTQIIQPYQFGHSERKATCLWLKGLPALKSTNIVVPDIIKLKGEVSSIYIGEQTFFNSDCINDSIHDGDGHSYTYKDLKKYVYKCKESDK